MEGLFWRVMLGVFFFGLLVSCWDMLQLQSDGEGYFDYGLFLSCGAMLALLGLEVLL